MFSGALANLGDLPRHLWLRTDDGSILDEAMACRERGGVLLTLHGGTGVRRAVERHLKGAGWAASEEAVSPFGGTAFERKTLGLLPQVKGPSAVTLVLEAAQQGDALWNDLASGKPTPPDAAPFLIVAPRVQLWGPVNAGKSSLLNALCGRELASAGAEPGLTRDIIEGRLCHKGFELRLFDAPGVWAEALTELDEQAVRLAQNWRQKADLTIELVPPGGDPPAGAWWYHSRVDESGLPGLSVKRPETLAALKDRLVEWFFGPLTRLPAQHRYALHPELRADLQALSEARTDAATLRSKWLS